jgi:YD repeat-containing protein
LAPQTWTQAYDKTDNLKSVTDPRSNTFQWSFDSLNRLISETDEDSNLVALTRNGKDEITNYSDPRSLDTSYIRNGFGDVIQRTSPDRDDRLCGQRARQADAGYRRPRCDHRPDLRRRRAAPDQGIPGRDQREHRLHWDSVAGGNKGKGRLTKIEDVSGSIEWTYNALGQATQEKKTTSTDGSTR